MGKNNKGKIKDSVAVGIEFKKSLGQNFLFDVNLLNAIAKDGGVCASDVVLEIGAGAGTLTEVLAEKAKKVISFEIDNSLMESLQKIANNHDNIEFYFQDFMEANLDEILSNYDSVKVVANIPYYITTPIIFKLVKNLKKIKSILVLVQKEVALRFASSVGNKDYGITSVILQSMFDVTVPREVKKECFTPSPKVDSALCKLVPHNRYKIAHFDAFTKLVKTAFSMRRKTLVNNLKQSYDIQEILQALKQIKCEVNVRPENLTTENFIALHRILNKTI